MRNVVILVLIVIAIGLVRALVGDVIKAAGRAMTTPDASSKKTGSAEAPEQAGRLVRDPQTGNYIDESSALRATIDGREFFFESAATRDAYLQARS